MTRENASTTSRRQFLKSTYMGAAGIMGLGSLGLTSRFASAQNAPAIQGSIAPELQVPYWLDAQGKKSDAFSIRANRGKWIYLKCFQDWCPSCHSVGFPNLQQLLKAFPNNTKLTAVAIQTTFEGHSFNTPGDLRKNQLKYELEIPFGHDQGDEDLPNDDPKHYPSTMINYQTRGTPWVTVINPQGVVVYSNFSIKMDTFIEYLREQGV